MLTSISGAINALTPTILVTDKDPADSPYNYIPTESIAIVFIVLFGLSTALHTGQSLYHRLWWLLPTAVLAGLLEVLGWSARLWSSINPPNSNAFQMQIVATIIAPTPLVAANFIILGRVIERLGPCYSRISPKLYTIVFTSFDIVSLVIQGVGGGIAASADTNSGANLGAKIMLGGICFQTVTLTLYSALATEFLVRYHNDNPIRPAVKQVDGNAVPIQRGYLTTKLKIMILALIFTTTCLFIRSIYRVAELADGWNGRIISTQIYFVILDAVMVILSMVTINLAHPGLLLGPHKPSHPGSEIDIAMLPTDRSNRTLV